MEGGGGIPRKANKSQGKTFPHHLPQMSKIQNISINVEKSGQFSKSLSNLDKYWQSWLILTISIDLDNLNKYLDADKPWFKNFDLDTMDNLDGFQKLVLADQEISIGLDCRDPPGLQ